MNTLASAYRHSHKHSSLLSIRKLSSHENVVTINHSCGDVASSSNRVCSVKPDYGVRAGLAVRGGVRTERRVVSHESRIEGAGDAVIGARADTRHTRPTGVTSF
ncbi:hypothetical protein EVAR_58475_1 [Eumeta japonica]|uniref:Uncharacterized protein n=1 Tax=Eumeta variegata TaxID=151549 RepID=A0A4C1YK45_EUMVA|nr:hypothetical protein EVAR_58475_1 [Eumeta japonica]